MVTVHEICLLSAICQTNIFEQKVGEEFECNPKADFDLSYGQTMAFKGRGAGMLRSGGALEVLDKINVIMNKELDVVSGGLRK